MGLAELLGAILGAAAYFVGASLIEMEKDRQELDKRLAAQRELTHRHMQTVISDMMAARQMPSYSYTVLQRRSFAEQANAVDNSYALTAKYRAEIKALKQDAARYQDELARLKR